MLARFCKFVLPKLQTIYNIHQYTSTYNHSFGILQIVSHDSTLSSPSLGGAARDFQVTTGTRIVEASTDGRMGWSRRIIQIWSKELSWGEPSLLSRHWSKVGCQKIRYFLYTNIFNIVNPCKSNIYEHSWENPSLPRDTGGTGQWRLGQRTSHVRTVAERGRPWTCSGSDSLTLWLFFFFCWCFLEQKCRKRRDVQKQQFSS